jgi:redox-sensitive bicupin YhaK (pirin superfamily)
MVKPFVFLDHFDFSGPSDGGQVHPHSGIATHTTLLEGSLTYGDSTGKSGLLRAGGVEWMRAGGGVWHGGTLPPGRIRGFQLWVALEEPLELAPAESHYVDASSIPSDGKVRVLLGSYGELQSAVPYPQPVTYLNVNLADGERWTYRPHTTHDVAWLAVSLGKLRVADALVSREMVIFEEGNLPIDVVAQGDGQAPARRARLTVRRTAQNVSRPWIVGRSGLNASRRDRGSHNARSRSHPRGIGLPETPRGARA